MSALPKNHEEKLGQIGGPFRLMSLIVKRARELMGKTREIFAGADGKDGDLIERALRELEDGRIGLRLSQRIEDE